MKIYTCIEIDMETGATLHEESYEYIGPIAECKGGSSKAPQPSAEEKALYATQNELLKQQLAETKTLSPMIYKQLGMKPVTDDKGATTWVEMTADDKLAAMTPSERSALEYDMLRKGMDINGNKISEEDMLSRMLPLEKQTYETQKVSNDRYMKALKGELPISPGLEAELKDQEGMMEETLKRKLGADWMLSTPGQKAYQSMKQKTDLVREEARRGEIESASNRTAQGMTLIQDINKEKANDLAFQKGSTQTMLSNMANMPGRTSGTMSQAGQMAGPYQQMREMQNNVKQQNAANKAAERQGYVQAGSAIAAAAAIAAA